MAPGSLPPWPGSRTTLPIGLGLGGTHHGDLTHQRHPHDRIVAIQTPRYRLAIKDLVAYVAIECPAQFDGHRWSTPHALERSMDVCQISLRESHTATVLAVNRRPLDQQNNQRQEHTEAKHVRGCLQ